MRRIAASFMVVLALASLAVAAGPRLFERTFPEDTALLVALPDARAAGEEFRSTALYELFQDPEMRAMFAPFVRQWRFNWQLAASMSPVSPQELAPLFDGEAAFGLAVAGGDDAAFHLLLKPHSPEVAGQVIQRILNLVASMSGAEVVEAAAMTLYRFGDEAVLCVSQREGAFLFTFTGRDLAAWHERALARLGGASGGLGALDGYAEAVGKTGRHDAALFYLNPKPLFAFEPLAELAKLGIDEIGPALAGLSFQDRGIRISGYMALAGRGGPLASALPPSALTEADLAAVPKSADAFSLGALNLLGSYNAVLGLLGRFMPPSDFRELQFAIAGFEGLTGVPIEEFLGGFGDRMLSYQPALPAGMGQGTLVALEVKDPEATQQHLQRIMGAVAGWIGREAQVNPQQWARAARVERGDMLQVYPASALPAALTPNFVFADGWMGVGLGARDTLAAMRGMLASDEDVRAREDFRALYARPEMPRRFSNMDYSDSRAYFGNALEAIQLAGDIAHLAGKIALHQHGGELPFRMDEPHWLDPGRFPSDELIRQTLFGSLTVTAVEEGGVRFEHFSAAGPIPPVGRLQEALGGPATVPILAGMLLPALARARAAAQEHAAPPATTTLLPPPPMMLPREARARDSMAQLRHISTAIIAYVGNRDYTMPPDLSALFPDFLADKGILLDPEDDADQAPRLRDGKPTSYYYVGAVPVREMPPNAMILYTRPGIRPDFRIVAFYDRSVSRMSEDGFPQMLEEQKRHYERMMNAPGVDTERVRAFLEDRFYEERQ